MVCYSKMLSLGTLRLDVISEWLYIGLQLNLTDLCKGRSGPITSLKSGEVGLINYLCQYSHTAFSSRICTCKPVHCAALHHSEVPTDSLLSLLPYRQV